MSEKSHYHLEYKLFNFLPGSVDLAFCIFFLLLLPCHVVNFLLRRCFWHFWPLFCSLSVSNVFTTGQVLEASLQFCNFR